MWGRKHLQGEEALPDHKIIVVGPSQRDHPIVRERTKKESVKVRSQFV